MKKLSKAQERTIADAKKMIDEARAYDTFEEWQGETDSYCKGRGGVEFVKENLKDFEKYRKYYEKYREGYFLTNAGKGTLEALKKMGLVTVEEYSDYRKQGCVIDWVHLENY